MDQSVPCCRGGQIRPIGPYLRERVYRSRSKWAKQDSCRADGGPPGTPHRRHRIPYDSELDMAPLDSPATRTRQRGESLRVAVHPPIAGSAHTMRPRHPSPLRRRRAYSRPTAMPWTPSSDPGSAASNSPTRVGEKDTAVHRARTAGRCRGRRSDWRAALQPPLRRPRSPRPAPQTAGVRPRDPTHNQDPPGPPVRQQDSAPATPHTTKIPQARPSDNRTPPPPPLGKPARLCPPVEQQNSAKPPPGRQNSTPPPLRRLSSDSATAPQSRGPAMPNDRAGLRHHNGSDNRTPARPRANSITRPTAHGQQGSAATAGGQPGPALLSGRSTAPPDSVANRVHLIREQVANPHSEQRT